KEGDPADVGEVIAYFEPQEKPSENGRGGDQAPAKTTGEKKQAAKEEAPSKAADEEQAEEQEAEGRESAREHEEVGGVRVMPSARRLLSKYGLSPKEVEPTGPGGRLLQEDVLRHVKEHDLKEGE